MNMILTSQLKISAFLGMDSSNSTFGKKSHHIIRDINTNVKRISTNRFVFWGFGRHQIGSCSRQTSCLRIRRSEQFCSPQMRDINPSADDELDMSIAQLQVQLDLSIENEQYDRAVQLRDLILQKRTDVRLSVEEANENFYSAFRSGNLAAMAAIWGRGDHVQCIHPAAGCIAGRDSVLQSWKLVLSTGRMSIQLEDVRIFANETNGYVTCVEVIDADDSQGRIAATNIFEKQDGKWKIVHHHGSPLRSI